MIKLEKSNVINEILDDLKQFTSTKFYVCPYCDKHIEWDDADYYPEENLYICPKCRCEFNENELTELSAYDIFEEMYLNYKEKNNE